MFFQNPKMSLIKPTVAQPSTYYRENLSWKMSEESWNRAEVLKLDLHAGIPRATTRKTTGKPGMLEHGGMFCLESPNSDLSGVSRRIRFESTWPDQHYEI